MTFTSLFKYKNTESIFLLADGLLSTESPVDGNFIMPGLGHVGRPQTQLGLYMHSLEQKLTVIDENLVFGYAGSHELASDFGNKLYTLYYQQEFSFAILDQYCDSWVNSLDDNQKKEIALICVYRYKNSYHVWDYNMTNDDGYKHFSILRSSGSGTSNFKAVIEQEQDKITNDGEALGHAMCLVNKFYHDDLFVKKNYSQSFGGFYELVACKQDGICKLTDIFISTIIIDVRSLDEGVSLPVTFLKHDHVSGLTVLRELTKIETDCSDGSDMKKSFHLFFPIVDAMKPLAVDYFKQLKNEQKFFDSDIIGDFKALHSLIMLELHDEEYVLKIPLYYKQDTENAPISITHSEGQIAINLSHDFLQTIQENIDIHFDIENKCFKKGLTQ